MLRILMPAAVLAASSGAAAQFTMVSGNQRTFGRAVAFHVAGPILPIDYDLKAGDPLAPWSPADQHLHTVVGDPLNPDASGTIDSTYGSVLNGNRIALWAAARGHATGDGKGGFYGQFDIRQFFTLTFTVDAPLTVTAAAGVSRRTSSADFGGFTSITLKPAGGGGGGAIWSYTFDGSSGPPTMFAGAGFPRTALDLAPGTYTLDITSINGHRGNYEEYTHALVLITACPADCDDDGAVNILDFACFQDAFGLSDPFRANCTADVALDLGELLDARPRLDINDFTCFQDAFAQGCP